MKPFGLFLLVGVSVGSLAMAVCRSGEYMPALWRDASHFDTRGARVA